MIIFPFLFGLFQKVSFNLNLLLLLSITLPFTFLIFKSTVNNSQHGNLLSNVQYQHLSFSLLDD